jgi:hypothetical protein
MTPADGLLWLFSADRVTIALVVVIVVFLLVMIWLAEGGQRRR